MSDNQDRPDDADYYRHLMENIEAREQEREQAEKSLTPEQLQTKHENEQLPTERELLREHMGLPGTPGGPSPPVPQNVAGFFIEVAAGQATCKLPTCRRFIKPGDYRMALNPAMALENWRRGRLESVDYYHIRCFEKIADFTQSAFVERVQPITRSTYRLRGLAFTNASSYMVDAGAERLILSWIVTRKRLIRRRDGLEPEDNEPLEPDFADLLFNAGLPSFAGKKPPHMSVIDYLRLRSELAPNESDGPADEDPWNLFEEYLDETPEGLNNVHNLSDMLSLWQRDQKVATANIDIGAHEGGRYSEHVRNAIRHRRDELGPKAIRALKRMSVILMPAAR